MPPTTKPRAIGIVRVSQLGDRDRDRFSSPKDQADAMRKLAREQGWRLTIPEPHEINVSGDWPLEDRPQLSRAVLAVQTGAADVIVGAFTERLWWSHSVREQVLKLVQGAGGQVWSADEGELTNGTPAAEFTGTVRTAADRLSRKQNAHKSLTAVDRAIAAGRVPWPGAPVGYLRDDDGRLKVDRQTAPIVRAAFKLRAKGATVEAVRDYLASRGVDRSYHGVSHLLRDRCYLGEIHFGARSNLAAHKPIITRELFAEVQAHKVERGRRAPSDRILARLGVLRCGTCGGAMSVGTHRGNGRSYPFYRCPGKGSRIAAVRDCPDRVAIGATIAEDAVIAATREAIADVQARAGAAAGARQADADLRSAQADLDAALATFTASGVLGEPVAVRRLADLRQARDDAQARKEQLGDRAGEVILRGGRDWDRLSLDARRDLIRAVVRSASVRPGRGPDRITIELYGD